MKSPAFTFGFITGLLIVTVFAVVLALVFKKKNGPVKFDERQQLARGKAYKTAFWVLTVYLLANGLFQIATGLEWADLMTCSFVGICLAITVFVIACIKNDAYFAVNERPKLYFGLFIGLTVINLCLGISNLLDGDVPFFIEGRLNYHAMSFVIVAVFLAILTAMSVKMLTAKKGGDEM